MTRFLTPFFETLYAKNKVAMHLVLDEADAMAPQNPMPEGRRLLGAVDKIARRGRVKGFRLWSITQRPAVLNKNVLSQISTLVAMQLNSPQDRKAIEAWVRGNADTDQAREVLDTLPQLARGEGWVWCPSLNVLGRERFPLMRTFDSSATPEHGAEQVEAKAFANVDVGALRAALSVVEPEAGSDATAPAGRRKRGEIFRPAPALDTREYDRGFAEGHGDLQR